MYEPYLRRRYMRRVWKQLQSGWIGPGNAVKTFGRRIRRAIGRDYAVITNSGSSALLVALKSLELESKTKQGDPITIACPAYGLPACHNAAKLLGYRVKLIDVNTMTCSMEPARLREYINLNGCAAVVAVGHNGYAGVDMRRIAGICKEHKIPFIEDSAVGLGCPHAGTIGDISILSFSVPKILTTGQGGAMLTDDRYRAAVAVATADQGGVEWRKTRIHDGIGGNFRMTDMQAALGHAQLDDFPHILTRRHLIWNWYRDQIPLANDIWPSGWLVTAWANTHSAACSMISALALAKFEAHRLYRPVFHNAPFEEAASKYPGAIEVYNRLVYLPSSLTLTKRQVAKICSIVERYI